jgi:hypothetical protein
MVNSDSHPLYHIFSSGASHRRVSGLPGDHYVPQLFGHEIIAILCGVVWGLWIGFAIVAAGTFLGELGNF